jgi:outer membrane receptor for Fe3+-dicitrate
MVKFKTTAMILAGALVFFAASGLLSSAAFAQAEATPTPTPTPTSSTTTTTTTTTTAPAATTTTASPGDQEVTTLEKYTVSDVPISEQILPTVRPVDSVMGDAANVLDIPRSVSTINKAWMDDRQIKNAMDFGQFSPGVYSPARYGVPTTPLIRGDNAQMYYDGQQALYTGSSIFPSFNGVEGMDIVKGPGSAVFGPQSQAPGGYVNYDMKEPQFDGEHTQISATLGYWASGHSYSNPEFTIDTGMPITDKLAVRVSYLSRYGDGYYDNDPNQTQDIYAALIYRFSTKLTLKWWSQFYESYFNDVTGANRVTQNYIWNGTYIGGQVTAYPDAYAGNVVDGSYGVLNPATAYTVKLPAYDTGLLAPGDSCRTGRFQSQLTATLELPADQKLINKLYFEDSDDREFNFFGYDEYMPIQQSIQDRLEYHATFTLGPVTQSIIAGGDFRFERLVSYQDYSVEPFFYYDLYDTKSPTYLQFPGYYAEGGSFGGSFGIPGVPGYSTGLDGYPSLQDSHIYDSAAFVQDTINFNKYLSAVIGLRGDEIYATDANPGMTQVFNTTTGQIYSPALPIAQGSFFNTSGSRFDPSEFASIIFKLSDTASLYATYDRVDSILGSANFGGVNVYYEYESNPNSPDFHNELETAIDNLSLLYEVGYKQSFLNNTLYFAGTLYQQDKTEPQINGIPFQVKAQGLELESVYQPTKALSLNANFTYQTVTDFGSGFFQQTYSYLDGYPVGFMVDGQSGTGNGSPNYSAVPQNNYAYTYVPPNNRMRAPGEPAVLANAFVQYQWKNGFGFGVGPQFKGWMYADDDDNLHIPSQIFFDGYIYFRQKTWDVSVNIQNITNARILDPVDVTFAGNDVVYIRQPVNASITFRYRL